MKLPDVCDKFEVPRENMFNMLRELSAAVRLGGKSCMNSDEMIRRERKGFVLKPGRVAT